MNTRYLGAALVAILAAAPALAQQKPRARDLGVPFPGTPGPLNAITDVSGVEVGYTTLASSSGRARTGVTAIFPRGKSSTDSVFAGSFVLNGNGELTGMAWVDEGGFLDGPIAITNTHSVGTVRDAIVEWQIARDRRPVASTHGPFFFSLPVVGETADVLLNDMSGFHVKKEHVFAALDGATPGPVAEGNVGGGTGMICHGWKGGTGTASRRLSTEQGGYTVGVLVQANHGNPRRLTIAGVPVGAELVPKYPRPPVPPGAGSIIVVVATDAPLLPKQLDRLAKRAALGIARVGGLGENSSGDLLVAFSIANPGAVTAKERATVSMVTNDALDPLFGAAADATEEAIVNVLVAAETMTGANNFTVPELPHDALVEILRKYNRLAAPVVGR
jgi:D-aminopeptidase